MKQQYHILNGDALKKQFPKKLQGEIIIARECLVDGPVHGASSEQFYKTRAQFLNDNYVNCSLEDYLDGSASQFKKVMEIPEYSEIHLWFEDDLFCQVNLWYMLHLLLENKKEYNLFLIRPKKHTRYGFGGLTETEMHHLFLEKTAIKQLYELGQLWYYYQNNDLDSLVQHADKLHLSYPFIKDAVQAHLDRIPSKDSLGSPKESLKQIVQEFGAEFDLVFNEFCERNPIYGFGDMQVKRMYDELMQTQ